MKNYMLDIETAALTANAAILSIGAVAFAPLESPEGTHYGEIHYRVGRHFKSNISLDSNRAEGLIIQAKTLKWWDSQSKEAQNGLFFPKQVALREALQTFKRWLGDEKFMKDTLVWAAPSNFDFPILETAFNACGIGVPWHYRNTRCASTLKFTAKLVGVIDSIGEPIEGVEHDSLCDARYQAECAARYMEKLTGNVLVQGVVPKNYQQDVADDDGMAIYKHKEYALTLGGKTKKDNE